MNRIEKKFEELKASNSKGLVGYLTAGDPDVVTSETNIRSAIDNGLDVLELGVPFSDPTADGPTIQAASHRSLAEGMTFSKTLDMVKNIRDYSDIPIVLFGYANPLFSYGYEQACEDAANAGVDGMLIVDLPYEECDELCIFMDKHDLIFIPLIAPTTPKERAAMILEKARGFVYYIMVTGVTGAREETVVNISEQIAKLRECSDLPIAAGFGISNGEQASVVAKSADAVVVGSALIRAAGTGDLAELVKDIKQGIE